MSRWLLALVLVAAGPAGAGARNAIGAIDECLGQIDRGLDVGYQRIAERCPDLTPSLMQSPWAAWLPPDWQEPANLLTAEGLEELRSLLKREPALAGARDAPNVGQVAAVLAKITPGDEAREGWWTRLKRWLREVLGPQPQPAGEGWWRRLFGEARLPQVWIEALGWGALLSVVLLAAGVVANELRVAGLLKRPALAPVNARTGARGAASATFGDFERQDPLEQLPLLLELIVTKLAEQERLPPARALTVHELTRAARLPGDGDRERLGEVAAACERMRFSGRRQDPGMLALALAQGRALLETLETDLAPRGAR